MKDIIKAQFYQLTKEFIPFFTLIGITLCSVLITMAVELQFFGETEPKTGCECFAESSLGFVSMAMLFVAITVPMMCGNDFLDKTTNYELLSGHIRREVFFGRAIPTIIVGTLGYMIASTAPVIATTIKNGWGDYISIEDACFRLFLMFFPVIRIICELIFLSFIIKNPYIVMALGWLSVMIGNMLIGTGGYFSLGITTIGKVVTVDSWSTYGLEENINFIYDAAFPAADVALVIISSVVVSAASLYLGYIFFKKDDLN